MGCEKNDSGLPRLFSCRPTANHDRQGKNDGPGCFEADEIQSSAPARQKMMRLSRNGQTSEDSPAGNCRTPQRCHGQSRRFTRRADGICGPDRTGSRDEIAEPSAQLIGPSIATSVSDLDPINLAPRSDPNVNGHDCDCQ
jgi:hypothetical protein